MNPYKELLNEEQRIVDSGIREIFTPHRPVMFPEFFYGRKEHVNMIISQINTPGQHSLLFGHRGVGKSSLANYVSTLAQRTCITIRCDSRTTFQKIVIEIDRRLSQVDTLGPQTTIPLINARSSDPDLAPSFLVDLAGDANGLVLLDEAEAIQNPSDRKQLAELIKHLSDSNARLKLLIVGVAETGEELIGAHPSIARCLKETPLEPMSDVEITQIIRGGAKNAKLDFVSELVEAITQLSAGYPHFAHLLALKCAEIAIAKRTELVKKEFLHEAMRRSARDAENSLSATYKDAVRSSTTQMYERVLYAASLVPEVEISASQLRSAIEAVTEKKITQGSLNNYLKNLVADDGSRILRRVKQGIYRFTDPRMKIYVKLVNLHMETRERARPPTPVEADFFNSNTPADEDDADLDDYE